MFLSKRLRASDRENVFSLSKKENGLKNEIFSTTAKNRNIRNNNVAFIKAIKMLVFLCKKIKN